MSTTANETLAPIAPDAAATAAFEQSWNAWQQQRFSTASAPYGTAALAHTHWLSDQPAAYEGAPGLWAQHGETLVATELPGGGQAQLRAGEQLEHDGVLLRAFDRDGSLALRVIDPNAPTRTSLQSIVAYAPSAEWQLRGVFTADEASIDITSVDGYVAEGQLGGRIALEIAGEPVTLTVTRNAHGLSAVFADGASGGENYRFRFLVVSEPDADGTVLVDFNRAYLPPCAFSDQYVCPLPLPGNRWAVPVLAGERRVERAA